MRLWSSLVVVVTAMSAAQGKFAYSKVDRIDVHKDQPTINGSVVHGDPAFNKTARMDNVIKVQPPPVKAIVVLDPLPPKVELKNLTRDDSSSVNTLLQSKKHLLNTTSPPKTNVSSEKLFNDMKILKINMAKYLRSKFQDTFSGASNLLDLEVAKKTAAYYVKRLYNLYPDLSAAAVQYFHPSINKRKDDLYKVYGRSRVPDDKTCPHHINETIACALQISNPVLNKILKRLGY